LPDTTQLDDDGAAKKTKEIDGPPPEVSELDGNGNKKSEVDLLMERADHDEANEKWLHSSGYKKQ